MTEPAKQAPEGEQAIHRIIALYATINFKIIPLSPKSQELN